MIWIAAACAALTSYLLGSIPSGFIMGKIRGVDLRKEGSGNIGATNALRVLGKKWGYIVFAADIIKGWAGVMSAFLVAIVLGLPEQQIIFFGILGACFSVVGHIFPVWLGFKGGKGIATSGGVMLALFPIWVFIAGLAIWLLLFFVTRYVSIASIAAALMLPTSSAVLTLFGMCDWYRTGIALILCILAIFKHKENIQRLLAGTEKRFEKKPKTAAN